MKSKKAEMSTFLKLVLWLIVFAILIAGILLIKKYITLGV